MKNEIVKIADEAGVAVVEFQATSISGSEGIALASEQIRSYVAEHQPNMLLFDFGKVKFFSSQVLGLLLDMRSRLKEYGGRVAISTIDPQLCRVFRITNLDKIFNFYPTKSQAVAEMTCGNEV